MTKFKHILINVGIVVGNIFLSHGLYFVDYYLIGVWDRFENRPMNYQQIILAALCAVQIAVNIILYKTLLKRHFAHPDQRKTGFYFLLPVIGLVLWNGSMFLAAEIWDGLNTYDPTYAEVLIFFLPVFLLTLIPLAVVYRLFFRKYVGEVYCTYMLSVLGVAIIPITFIIVLSGTG